MPSKGIKCYAYIGAPDITLEFSVPEKTVTRREQHKFTTDHLEVESKNLPRFKFTGRFSFKVSSKGKEITTQWTDVNSLTGSLENGTLNTMDQTPAVFKEGLVVCYGFYDAGPGHAGLPKQHQCYVTVTREMGDWMRELVPPNSSAEKQKFSKMVLPSAHDIGMNSMTTSMAMLQKAGTTTIRELLKRELPGALSVVNKIADSAVKHIAPDIIRALAITQKDSLETIMRIGARYFEFRPAKCHRQMQKASPLPDELYFQHGAIPGMPWREFVDGVVEFLLKHEEEIVVVQCRWDGVPGDAVCPRGTAEARVGVVHDTIKSKNAGEKLKTGTEDDMRNRSIAELRQSKKRLILTRDLRQASNYTDEASATLTGDPIVSELKCMSEKPPKGHALTFLQCQATATNIRDVIVASVLDSDVSTSPLLATKGVVDHKILPLLRGDTGKKLVKEEGLVVIVNDFFDGATAECAIELCRGRLGV